MKNIYRIGYAAMLTAVVGITACSDKFLEEKRNYGNFNAADSYGSAAAATELR